MAESPVSGPWEKYQAPSVEGPWTKYAQAPAEASFDDRFAGEGEGVRPAMEAPLIAKAEDMGRPTRMQSLGLGAVQGASMNWLDELSGALGASFDKRADETWTQAYERHSGAARSKLGDAQRANPGTFLSGEVAGGVGSALLLPGTTTIRGAAATGAGLGAVSGAGAGEGASDTVNKAAGGAALGGAVGAAAGKVAQAIAGRQAAKAVPAVEEIKDSSRALYDVAEEAGIVFKPEALQRLGAEVKAALAEKAYHPRMQTQLAPVVEHLDELAKGNVTLKGMDTLRQMALNARSDLNDKTRMMAGSVVGKIDDFLDDVRPTDVLIGDAQKGIPALTEARSLWKAAKKGEIIDQALERAANNAGAGGSGGNIDNLTRQQFRSILNSPSKRRAFSQDELTAMVSVVRGGPLDGVLRTAAKLSPNGNGLMAYLQAVGGITSGGATVPLAIGGAAAKQIADGATKARAERVGALVRNGGEPIVVGAPEGAANYLTRSAAGMAAANGGVTVPLTRALPIGGRSVHAESGPGALDESERERRKKK